MKRIICFVVFLCPFALIKAQDPTLFTINDSIKVSKSEFERTYKKNNSGSFLNDPKNVDDYLQLYINFRLKVQEAESQKLDTNPKFVREYKGYVKQLSEPYLVDTNIDSKYIREAYERLKWQIRSSHILVQVSLGASPKDTMIAYQKAISIRNRILKGESFDSLAKKLSDDPSAKSNNGDIGYMTVFSTVYEYENALYTLKPGEISMPVRTKFGYHIIKVTDKIPVPGDIRMAHILLNARSADSTRDLKAIIDSAYAKLRAGVEWSKVVKQYSDDNRTKNSDGVFPGWIGVNSRFPQEFKEIAFQLPLNQYSQPFKTEFGWHIVKIIEKRLVMPYDEAVSGLKTQISKDPSRNNAGKISVANRLKKEYKLTIDNKKLQSTFNKIDTSFLRGVWKRPANISKTLVLATFGTDKITEDDFLSWLLTNQRPGKQVDLPMKYFLDKLWNLYTENRILEYEKMHLTEKYADLKYLLKEYHDGMLLFDLTDKMVWTKSNIDSVGIQAFYDKNKANYVWGQRVEVAKYTCEDEATATALSKLIAQRAKKNIPDSEILKKLNKKDTKVSVETLKYSKGDDANVDKLEQKVGANLIVEGKTVIEFKKVIAPQTKELNDCRGLVIADYQKQLEDDWIAKLRSQNKVIVDQAVLSAIKQSLK